MELTWTCPVCATCWPEKPVGGDIHGCPECGPLPVEDLG